jgi:hypothetical protein
LAPILVRPSNCTKGSITVSAATSTPASMTQVSGRKMVTPWAISRLAVFKRSVASSATSSAMVLAPSTSAASAA